MTTKEKVAFVLDVWRKAVDVQQHFNDIELRIRNIAVTVIAAVIGATAVALGDAHYMLGFGIVMAGLVALLAFFVMDYVWYHPLLKGAVKYAEALEERLNEVLPDLSVEEVGLTGRISAASKGTFMGMELDSKRKMGVFYSLLALPLGLAAILALLLAKFGTPAPETADEPAIMIVNQGDARQSSEPVPGTATPSSVRTRPAADTTISRE